MLRWIISALSLACFRMIGRAYAARKTLGRVYRLCISALIPLLAACAVGPNFETPQAPVAAKWLEARNPSVNTRGQDYHRWWTAFVTQR
jgi:hypothetical protein